MKKIILIQLLLCCMLGLQAQIQNNNWILGNGTAANDVKFNIPTVGPINASANATLAGQLGKGSNACYSNSSGSLLFSTNGEKVFNPSGVAVTGISLAGSKDASQNAIIAPNNLNPDHYYIFTRDKVGGTNGIKLYDLDATAGIPSATTSLVGTLDASDAEKMAVCENPTGIGTWWVAYANASGIAVREVGYNTGTSSNFINAATVNLFYTGYITPNLKIGQMKFSPNRQFLAVAADNLIILYNFNAATGSLTVQDTNYSADGFYGVEFSGNSNYLYTTSLYQTAGNYGKLKRYTVGSSFFSSCVTVSTSATHRYCQLQLMPDCACAGDRIAMATLPQASLTALPTANNNLSILNMVNAVALPTTSSQPLIGNCLNFGLPTYAVTDCKAVGVTTYDSAFVYICNPAAVSNINSPIAFNLSTGTTTWLDPLSGGASGTLSTPYVGDGIYTVFYTTYSGCVTQQIDIYVSASISGYLHSGTILCGSNSPVASGTPINLTSSFTGIFTPPLTYSWSGPAGFTSTLQNPTIPAATAANAGTYNVLISDAGGCTTFCSSPVSVSTTYTYSCAGSGIVTNYPIITGATNSSTALGLTTVGGGNTIMLDNNAVLTIDANTIWTGVTVVCKGDAKIIVQSGKTFTLNGSNFKGCTHLWKGIEVQSGASIVSNGSSFKDAIFAVEVKQGATAAYFSQNSFTNNYIGILRSNTSTTLSACSLKVQACIFENSLATGALLPLFTATYGNPSTIEGPGAILPTSITTHSFAGIVIKYANTITDVFGNNQFKELNTGVYLQACQSTVWDINYFTNCLPKIAGTFAAGYGLYNNGTSSGAGNLLTVVGSASAIEFSNCENGIVNDNSNAKILYNRFDNIKNNCISHQTNLATKGALTADDNRMTNYNRNGIRVKYNVPMAVSLSIQRNNITANTAAFINKACISVECIVPHVTLTSGSTIFKNTLNLNNVAIPSYGIQLINTINARVSSNDITCPNANSQIGISSNGGTTTTMVCNKLTSPNTTAVSTNKGIFINNVTGAFIRCNTITKFRRDIHITGTATGTSLIANALNNPSPCLGSFGIDVTTATGLPAQVMKGNSWTTAWAAGGRKIIGAAASPLIFTCPSTPAINNPTGWVTPVAIANNSGTGVQDNCNTAPICGSLTNKTDETTEEPIIETIVEPKQLFNVYPNPATDVLNVQNYLVDDNSTLYIFDMSGKLIKQVAMSNYLIQIPIADLVTGTYIVKARVGNAVEVKKFIKQ
jgi:hypothetical protein